MRKQTLFILTMLLLCASCGEKKEAQAQLEQIKTYYEMRQYATAKGAIDSLRRRYPKQAEIIRATFPLMRQIEMAESRQNIAYCDSLMPIKREEAEALMKGFVLEKDPKYEEVGRYVWKQQTVESNVQRSYLRCSTDEQGEITLTSIYYGSGPINHTGLKFSLPDGTYAETASIAYDGGMNYRFKDLGATTEMVNYKGADCMEAVSRIAMVDPRTRIKVEYTGGKPFTLTLGERENKVIQATYALAIVLNDLEVMRREQVKATKKIAYLEAKMAEGE